MSFKWKTADGRELSPATMTTPHLFNTVRVIWNAVMPEEARVEGGNLYRFEPPYTGEYLMAAVQAMLPTLLERPDVTPHMRGDLRAMAAYCAKNRVQLSAPLRSLI